MIRNWTARPGTKRTRLFAAFDSLLVLTVLSSRNVLLLTFEQIDLLQLYEKYQTKTVFHVGDIVRWKAGLKSRNVPGSDDVAIVTEIFPAPVFDPKSTSAGAPTFHEPLTIRIGLILDNMFREFFFEGARLEVVDTNELTEDQRNQAEQLTMFREYLHQPRAQPLAVGDIVRWKPGMRDSKFPKDSQQVVVMETFPAYVSDKKGACSTGFREPVDVRLAFLDEDDDVRMFVFDSRRFEKVPESEIL